MAVGMAVLGFGALFGGYIQVPGIDATLENWFEPVFEASPLYAIVPPVGQAWLGLAFGSLLSILGISLAYYLYIVAPGSTDRIRDRFSYLHRLFFNKYYFDELQDALIVRPVQAVGRFANNVVERYVVQGLVTMVRDGVIEVGSAVRAAQSGFVRSYALLVIAGFVALALYFLIAAA
jgi:NADH-quinone oxidoreductase subunit L